VARINITFAHMKYPFDQAEMDNMEKEYSK